MLEQGKVAGQMALAGAMRCISARLLPSLTFRSCCVVGLVTTILVVLNQIQLHEGYSPCRNARPFRFAAYGSADSSGGLDRVCS